MRRMLLSLSFACLGLLLSGPAAAVSLWHGDVYTSSLLGNAHFTITLPTNPESIPALLGQADLDVLGAGLGSAYVQPGQPITLTHTFAPGVPVTSIQSAALRVSVIDDFDIAREEIAITVGSDLLDSRSSRLLVGIFGGNVAAVVAASGDAIQVTIAALAGDFHVAYSALSVEFTSAGGGSTPGPTPAVPEPSAAWVFALALALVARRR
jgi:hypothetical protein